MPRKGQKGIKQNRVHGAPVGKAPLVSKATVLTALRSNMSIADIAKQYNWNQTTMYRWRKMDPEFARSFTEITSSPDYQHGRKFKTKGLGVVQADRKPRWTEQFLAQYQQNGEKVKSCRAVSISLEMLEEALNPNHPSFEAWFYEKFQKIEKEHNQEIKDKIRKQAIDGNTTMLRYLAERASGPVTGKDEEDFIDDADIRKLLMELSTAPAATGEADATGIPAEESEPVS